MQKHTFKFNISKRMIKLVTAAILSYPFGNFFKSLHNAYWFTLLGALIGISTGLFLIPYLSDSISFELLAYRLWWMRLHKIRPYLLDSSTILDGRVVELVKTGIIDRSIYISSVTMDELDRLNKSSEIYSRRVKRGLDSIDKLKSLCKNRVYFLNIQKTPSSIREHILDISKKMQATILTLDTWITDNARKRNIAVVNIHELSMAFRIQILPKEMFEVVLSKQGKEQHQAIGYTEDGMMIIVEDGKPYIGKRVLAECTSVLQSTAGKIIFGQYIKTITNDA
jgi:uncharacterized protein YacL